MSINNPWSRLPLGPADSTAATTDVEMVDVDRDGFPDIVVGNADGPDVVYLSAGAALTPETLAGPGLVIGAEELSTRDIDVEDVNGDGVSDFVIATSDGANKVVYGYGFGQVFSNRLSTLEATEIGSPGSSQTVDVYDVDGDGDMDTVFGNTDQTASTYYNDGAGTVSEDPGKSAPVGIKTEPEPPATTAAGVLSPTGGPDGGPTMGLVTGGEIFAFSAAEGWVKVGDLEMKPTDLKSVTGVAMVDLNGDGAEDIVVTTATGKSSLIYLNDGTGRFPSSTTIGDPADAANTKDAEGITFPTVDGVTSIVIANSDGASVTYRQGDGTGDYSAVSPVAILNTDGLAASSVTAPDVLSMTDLIADGYFVGVVGGPNKAFIPNGFGGTAEYPLGDANDMSATQDVEYIDVDGDTYPDIVIANSDGPDRLILTSMFYGDGVNSPSPGTAPRPLDTAAYASPGVVLGSAELPTRDIEVADLDGDGIADL